MELRSKITNYLITVVAAVLLISCKNSKNDVIPDVYVDFTINLNDPIFFSLNAGTNAVIVTSTTNNWGIKSAGYNYNGIIVYRSAEDKFYAYDRTCPHDFALDGTNVRLNIDFINAVCPGCNTTYSLEAMGTPVSGPGRYPLKNYKTSFDGLSVHVWH
jgi:nitrite reductase/ring-hydroxylating ferredoxin subunit